MNKGYKRIHSPVYRSMALTPTPTPSECSFFFYSHSVCISATIQSYCKYRNLFSGNLWKRTITSGPTRQPSTDRILSLGLLRGPFIVGLFILTFPDNHNTPAPATLALHHHPLPPPTLLLLHNHNHGEVDGTNTDTGNGTGTSTRFARRSTAAW